MLRQVASSSSSSLRGQTAAYCASASSSSSLGSSSMLLTSRSIVIASSRRIGTSIFTPPTPFKGHDRFYATTSNTQGFQEKATKDRHGVPPHSIKITHTTSPSKHQRGIYATRETLNSPSEVRAAHAKSTTSNSATSVSASQSSGNRSKASVATSGESQPTYSVARSDQSSTSAANTLPSQKTSPSEPAEKKTIMTRIKGIFKQLKYLFQFYLNGVKQIWRDRKRVQAIREAIQLEGGRQQSWAEARLLRTHTKDLKKLPLFLAILLILEEVLPLVVIYAPFLLPSTCILPSQVTKIRQSEEVKRAKAVEVLRKSREVQELMDVAGLPLNASLPDLKDRISMRLAGGKARQEEALRRWRGLSRDSLIALSRVFCLPTLARPAVILRSSLESHLLYIVQDDMLLANAAATRSPVPSPYEADSLSFTPAAELPLPTTSSTTAAEVLTERGLRTSGFDHAEMRRNLQGWLDLVSLFAEAQTPTSTSPQLGPSQQSAAPPALSLRRILLPLSLYPPPSLFTPSLKEMELREEKENEKGLVQRSKKVVSEVVSAREDDIRREKEGKADQLGKP